MTATPLAITGTVASAANVATLALVLVAATSVMGWLPRSIDPTERVIGAWTDATEPLAERHRLLPHAAAVAGYVAVWFLLLALSASWAWLAVTFAAPAFMAALVVDARYGVVTARGGVMDEDDRDAVLSAVGASYVLLWAVVMVWLSSLLLALASSPIPAAAGWFGYSRFTRLEDRTKLNSLLDGDTHATGVDDDVFALPMSEVYKSKADDVSTRSSFVPLPADRSMLFTGATRSGKTTAIKHLVNQMDADETEPRVILELKDDYKTHFREQGVEPLVLSADPEASTVVWNLFHELDPENVERDAKELAKRVSPEPTGGSNDYFRKSARWCLEAVILMLYYSTREDEPMPTNATVADYFAVRTQDEMVDELRSSGFTRAADSIDPDAGGGAQGVYTEVQLIIEEIFQGAFAADGDFSMREYINHPERYGGRPLVLDYSPRRTAAAPVYACLVADAIMHGLEDGNASRRKYYLLDEIEMIDARIDNLDQLQSLGQGVGCVSVLTLQSVAQLRSTYSDRADAILAGATTEIMLRAADGETVKRYQERIGKHREVKTGYTKEAPNPLGDSLPSRTVEREERVEDVSEFASGDLTSMAAGECVIVRGGGQQYVHGRVALPE